jgi:hypothetical protein
MDAYELHQELFKAWQQLGLVPNAATIKKEWNNALVYVDGKQITGVKIVDNKIVLETE